jgi:hypothetical protein
MKICAYHHTNKVFLKQLKRLKVKMEVISDVGPGGGAAVIGLTGKREALEDVVSNPVWGWDDPDLEEFIEESKVNEGKPSLVTKNAWKRMSDDEKIDALLTVVKDPKEAEKYYELDWEDLPSGFERDMTIYEGKLNEGFGKWFIEVSKKDAREATGTLLDEFNYKYKTKASNYFMFRNKVEAMKALHEFTEAGIDVINATSALTEGKVNEHSTQENRKNKNYKI